MTRDELDCLFTAVEEAAISNSPIDLHKIEDILLSGNFILVGFGVSVSIETLFETRELRWIYEREVFSARISPRARSGGVPGVEWRVSMTVCETGKYKGTSWERTHMLRKKYRYYGVQEKSCHLTSKGY